MRENKAKAGINKRKEGYFMNDSKSLTVFLSEYTQPCQ